jgi:NADH-quinone oxidoreductase subunit M
MIHYLQLLVVVLPALSTLIRPLTRRTALISVSLTLGLSGVLTAVSLANDVALVPHLFHPGLSLDHLTIWLVPYNVLIYWAILLCTPRAERSPASSARLLQGLSLDLAFFSIRSPQWMAVLWVLTHYPIIAEARTWQGDHQRSRLLRILVVYLGTGCLFFVLGVWGLTSGAIPMLYSCIAITIGIVLRKAIVPFHQWLPELFEKGPLGHVIAFCAPQLGAYASIRLLAPVAPEELLVALGAAALITAVYGACLACGQKSFRGAYAGLFMGQTSVVFAGLQCTSQVSLAGGLALWISGGLALTGLGLTVWAMEARRGRMTLDRFHGGYERSPVVATSFLIFGLTSCGFPGTLGFISEELLLEGTIHTYPHVGLLAAIAAALNGITVMRIYLRLFCGSKTSYAISQAMRPRERVAMLTLLAILLGFGLAPQAFIASRWQAAEEIMRSRVIPLLPEGGVH